MNPMIDTHCHLTYQGLRERVDEVLAAAADAGVDRMISVGTTPADAKQAIAVAERYDNVFATVGVHPHHAAETGDRAELLDTLRSLATHEQVVALGEMGLDYHYPEPSKDVQRAAFEAQLDIAAELTQLPIIIHNRKATDDTLAVLRTSGLSGQRFVFHCFTGTADELDKILDFGAYVGFTGIVTFNSAADVAEASDRVPLERMFIETDAPYLTPAPFRKVRPNEPRYVAEVARFMAKRRNMMLDDFTTAVDANAEVFFNLRESGRTARARQ